MKHFFYVSAIFLIWTLPSKAQDIWSLSRCIEYAYENNLQIQQQELNATYSSELRQQASSGRIPSLTAGASYNVGLGRTIDQFTNEYITSAAHTNQFSLSSSLTLFNGLQTHYSIQRADVNLLMALQDVEALKSDIALNIATAYLQILFASERVKIAENQLNTTNIQLDRTQKLVDGGTLAKGDLLEVRSQKASEEVQLVQAKNDVELSYLTLKQMLDLNSSASFAIAEPDLALFAITEELPLPADVYASAKDLPRIQSSQLAVQSAETSLNMAYWSRSPRLTLNAYLGTGYSSARQQITGFNPATIPLGYLQSDPLQLVVSDQNIPTMGNYPYFNQLADNASTSLSLNLTIPIFTNRQIKTNISSTSIQLENSKLNLAIAENQLYKDIQQAYANAVAAYSRYQASTIALEAVEESFAYTEQKFNLGVVTATEYNMAKNRIVGTQSDVLQAKYEYLFTKSVLDYYAGKPFELK